ncbi:phosphoribosylaminoimidazole-succinocarboxamide synthase [Agromyces luteolus]|uniref:Phosphoribosylaminoimidazole-succinocarboxamide synthase n=1 Tax=Agromyces luteolus TaxID=88373 RepID=A0A7C9HZZ5_9MICO|nr:phosphoribosylaminoimidazolesuccinocarboxamide synthase [Agromyces luteolus]MUN07520.1 phosphoribosylaminoimidazolesuccinocarboxamide synthase [Agromyces luteolus]GLK29134.1 phosphoribosylaminoimidazole-succinocarboxamide synthase [Agromyces luteolus]
MTHVNDLTGWTLVYSGKVRDLYVPTALMTDDDTWTGDPLKLSPVVLVVASDRVSAFDEVLEPEIPGKGALLTSLTRWWFDRLPEVPNHLAYAEDDRYHDLPEIPAGVTDRAMLCRTLDMFPIECVVRGYLTGSGYTEYVATGGIGGLRLPEGLQDGDRLPEPVYTPAWKAPLGQHDENISYERTVELVGETVAEQLRAISLSVFQHASEVAEERGLILADTKFEFGADRELGIVTLADEVLTSDSSRYWDLEAYLTGATPEIRMASFDKQIVRDWLAANWDRSAQAVPPTLPSEIVEQTAERYRALVERLTLGL